jgi:hypothetical protein
MKPTTTIMLTARRTLGLRFALAVASAVGTADGFLLGLTLGSLATAGILGVLLGLA